MQTLGFSKQKWLIFLGLLLLSIGITLRYLTVFDLLSTIFIIIGIVLKLTFIIARMTKNNYRPGVELLVLLLGLGLFFSGIFFNSKGFEIHSIVFKVTGISLKVLFVVLFIVKSNRISKKAAIKYSKDDSKKLDTQQYS